MQLSAHVKQVGQGKRTSECCEQANRRASGPVFQSVILVILDHSVSDNDLILSHSGPAGNPATHLPRTLSPRQRDPGGAAAAHGQNQRHAPRAQRKLTRTQQSRAEETRQNRRRKPLLLHSLRESEMPWSCGRGCDDDEGDGGDVFS